MDVVSGVNAQKNERPSWDEFWFTIALFYSTRGTCDRLKAACILVDKNNRLIGAGYNGSLPGDPHCDEAGHFMVDGHCLRTLHAEVNAIMHSVGDMEGGTAYVLGTPCIDCVKKLLTKKIKRVFFTRQYNNQAKGGKYIFELAKNQSAEIKYVNINFPEVLKKKLGILEGSGGAFLAQNIRSTLTFNKNKMRVQKINQEAKLPSFAYAGDAGMDIFSCEDCEIAPMERRAVGTGLKIAVPEGYAGFVWDKSGLALKEGLTTMAGVLDSGYRGEFKVVLLNLGSKPYFIKKHQKIAQLVVKKVERPEIAEDILDDTERGMGGFGSSGLV